MSTWKVDALENLVATIIDYRGKTPKKLGSEWAKEGIPAISAKNVKDGRIVNEDDIRFVDEELYRRWMKEELAKDDILLTSEAPLGEVCFLKEKKKMVLSQRLFALRPNKEVISPRFLFYYLKSWRGQAELQSRATGATAQGIRQSLLREVSVHFPEKLADQRKIATVLSVYDDLIESNLRRIKILEEMARLLYREWFVKFRFPGSENVKMADSPQGKIPEGWGVSTFGDVCDIISRGVTPKYEPGSGRFIINQKANSGPEIIVDHLKELRGDLRVPPEKFARKRDLLINCLGEGTIGRVHYFLGPDNRWAVDQHMSICRAEYEPTTCYLYFLMASDEGQARIQTLKSGGTNMTTLNISTLRAFEVIWPSAVILERFYQFAWSLFELKRNLQDSNQKLHRTRDMLLPRLISGELDVSEVDIDTEVLDTESRVSPHP